MYPSVDTRFPSDVEVEVQSHYVSMFPRGDRYYVQKAFSWAIECFTGSYKDYQPIDALYHDFEHTLQGTLCLARLLRGRARADASPALTQRMFELGIAAILLHDTGYLKTGNDREGTGAKYTLIHVNRSMEFAALLLREKGFTENEIHAVQHMIRCTGLNVDLTAIPFADEMEKMVGFSLGTSDLLGQMAADDYVDKLPILFLEFVEAARFNKMDAPAIGGFLDVDDLMRKTPGFWEKYVRPKIERDFQGVYRFLSAAGPGGPNYYVDRIEANINRLRSNLMPALA